MHRPSGFPRVLPLLLLALAACERGGVRTRLAAPGDTLSLRERERIPGAIVFISRRDGNAELYRVRPTGAGLRRLTDSPATEDFTGPLSPDGREMAAVARHAYTPRLRLTQVVLRPPAGGGARGVGPRALRLRAPSWSRDGRWILFESDSASFRDLYRVSRDGRRLLRLTDDSQGNYAPEVSPTGEWVVFGSSRSMDGLQLFRMRPDGSAQQRLTRVPRDHWGARWSSDGARIAFVSDRQGAERLWVMDADGGNQRRLTAADTLPATVEAQPAWSPTDPGRIAYAVRRLGEPARIRVQDVGGGRVREVPAGAEGGDDTPVWSGDGRYLAFTSTRDGDAELYLARADGSRPTRLTRARGADFDPVWVP